MLYVVMQVRTGGVVANEDILGFAKLFNDELTLDNINRLEFLSELCKQMIDIQVDIAIDLIVCDCSYGYSTVLKTVVAIRPRLVNMCKYMGIKPIGTDAYLRFSLRKRLQW